MEKWNNYCINQKHYLYESFRRSEFSSRQHLIHLCWNTKSSKSKVIKADLEFLNRNNRFFIEQNWSSYNFNDCLANLTRWYYSIRSFTLNQSLSRLEYWPEFQHLAALSLRYRWLSANNISSRGHNKDFDLLSLYWFCHTRFQLHTYKYLSLDC